MKKRYEEWLAACNVTKLLVGSQATLEGLVELLVQMEVERDFYKHLSEEFIKEKQKRIRDEKGVVYVGEDMYMQAPTINVPPFLTSISGTFIDESFDCTSCVCQCCDEEDCEGCIHEEERCEECTDLDEED